MTESELNDSCFAFIPPEARGPNGSKSLRKLRMCSLDTGRLDCGILGAAAAALSPGGFRGNRVTGIPDSAMPAVKRRIRSGMTSARCHGSVNEMPESVRP